MLHQLRFTACAVKLSQPIYSRAGRNRPWWALALLPLLTSSLLIKLALSTCILNFGRRKRSFQWHPDRSSLMEPAICTTRCLKAVLCDVLVNMWPYLRKPSIRDKSKMHWKCAQGSKLIFRSGASWRLTEKFWSPVRKFWLSTYFIYNLHNKHDFICYFACNKSHNWRVKTIRNNASNTQQL